MEAPSAAAYLLRQVRVLDPMAQGDRLADVLIYGGQIQAIAPELAAPPDLDAELITLERPDAVLGPGLVDCYSHASDPGFESRETIETLARSALAGGFTRLMLLPTTQPAVDHAAGLHQLQARFDAATDLATGFWGGLTQGLAGHQLSNLVELAAAGAVGFTNAEYLPFDLLYAALDYGQSIGKPVALSLCLPSHPTWEGITSLQLGLPGVLAGEEAANLARLLEHLETRSTPVHIMHLATARGVALVAAAKAKGLPITASTTWLHLLRDTTHLASYDPNLRVHPPLGDSEDRQALIAGVASGTIDAIAVEHRPYTYEEKTVPFAEAPPGVIGLQTALPLLWHHLVKPGQLSALALWQALSTRPAQCLQQSPPLVAVGESAELTLFDPHQRWPATSATLASRSSNLPWFNQEILGQVVQTWVAGRAQL